MRKNLSLVPLAILLCLVMTQAAQAQLGSLFRSKTAVPEVSAEQVRKLQTELAAAAQSAEQNGNAKPDVSFVIVDVRSEPEYAVSVIPGAITAKQYEQNRERYNGRTVITYCTSGYRSDKYARKLIEEGVTAKNFKGSILGWCAAMYPLETLAGESTNRVHTYSSRNKVPSQYKAVW
jgi:rhodanese-related sulfurtransferase